MGFHICKFPHPKERENRFPDTSSGDVNLSFKNGHRWVMPDMILHYVADHVWQPPMEFIHDVMASELAWGERDQTKGVIFGTIYKGTRVGYLEGEIKQGPVPDGFVERLEELMTSAAAAGRRVQTRGA